MRVSVLAEILQGIAVIADVRVWLAVAAGVFVGAIAGALPGVTTTTAMAMLAPFSFYLPATIGIPFLLGLFKGGVWGGSITAILLNLPGTNASIATCFDGYPLAQKGQARKAIDLALYASVTGETLSELVVLFIMGPLSMIALKFGPPELLGLVVLALSLVGASSGTHPVKGLASALIGLVLATIGVDPLGGAQRFTFGSIDLRSGLSFISVMIGLFCLPELIDVFRSSLFQRSADKRRQVLVTVERKGLSWAEYVRCLPAMLRGTVLGLVIGIIPALSQVVAALLGYGIEKRLSRHPQDFGQGALEGVAAPEAANNAVNGGAMVPMLTFGIPGDLVTAVLLGAFMANNLKPGPTLIRDNPVIMYGLLLTMVLGNFVLLGIGKVFTNVFIKAVQLPMKYLVPGISVLMVVGSFAVNNNLFDVWVMIVCGFLGYLLKKHGFPIPPMLITFLLGYRLEMYLSQTMLLGNGSLGIIAGRPIALITLVSAVVIALWSALRPVVQSRSQGRA